MQMTANGSFNMKQLNDEKTLAMFAFGGVLEEAALSRKWKSEMLPFEVHQTPVGTIDLWTYIKNKQPGQSTLFYFNLGF